MPVEFLTDVEAAAFGRYAGPPSRVDLEREFFLDDDDRAQDQGLPVREEDVARLSPFVHSHLGVHGAYTFALPDLAPGTIRDLRDPDTDQDDEEI